ncbi:hypothetical protein NLD30_02390 [SCandidatus Aminicenantes bacterium Aminicenantia_JdfR_composite]|jgi:hypothetical protein|nr:hypothetical protein [SCandidatus Aminicenantes bacterium Aminicenantia_JdfR_composite]MCP2597746.1 hypothetical protein [Candidatus Aminicenantes bacterium AC-335-L06]
MIKKIKFLFILLFLSYLSCQSVTQYKIKVEIPTPTKIDLSAYKGIIFTTFEINSEIKEIDFSKEIFNFFSPEIEREFKGEITFKEIKWDRENLIEDKDFWKKLSGDKNKKILFTGKLNFRRELRKALLEERRPLTSPFIERKLASRLFFILNLNLYLIDSSNGEIIYQKEFKETKRYENINQKASYAFIDILEEIKNKLFREIISHKKREERYLIL